MSKIAGIGKSYREKLSKVLERNPSTITPEFVSKTLNISAQEAGRLLSRWSKSGWVSRIKRGVYIPLQIGASSNEAIIEEPNLIADQLYGPGYIAGFSAVKHWDFSEQIIETATFFTLNKVKDRSPFHGGITFNLKTTSEYKFFGLKNIWYGSHKVKVSDPTKTIIDLLDDPKIVGGIRVVSDILAEYIESEHYDEDKILEYGKKMKNKTIFKRLGFLLAIMDVQKNLMESLKGLISKNYSLLDSTLECKELVNDWKLKVSSSWKLEYDRKK